MSRLEELMVELCPSGVKTVLLEKVCDITKGIQFNKCNMKDEGRYPVINGGINPSGYIEQYNQNENTITISQGGASAGFVNWLDVKFWAGAHCYVVKPLDGVLNRYVFHFIKSMEYKLQECQYGAGIPALAKAVVAALPIPVPPLEVQREIVRILDSFTLLTAELTARKKQYEFYRNKMLSFDTNVTRKRLGEIFDFRNGLSKGKEFFGSGIPFIRYTDVYNHRSLRKEDITALVECTSSELEKLKVSRGDVLFTRTSETAEDVGWSSVMLDDIGACVFNGFTIKATPKTDDLLPEYCAYCFATDSFRNYVTTHCAFTTRASLTGNTIAEYQIAIPSIDEQQQIANVLGNFEAMCSDLNIGLPAEIAARRKQYKYYRNKLLEFKVK